MHIILFIKYDPNTTPQNKSIGIFYDQWHLIPISNSIQSLNVAIVGMVFASCKYLAVSLLSGMVTFSDKFIVCIEEDIFPQFSLRNKS